LASTRALRTSGSTIPNEAPLRLRSDQVLGGAALVQEPRLLGIAWALAPVLPERCADPVEAFHRLGAESLTAHNEEGARRPPPPLIRASAAR
jgi:hypothetical protein